MRKPDCLFRMVIDFHTHVFPEKLAPGALKVLAERAKIDPTTDGTAEGLAISMMLAGIDISVTLPVITDPAQFESTNRFAASLDSRPYIAAFGAIHPDCGDAKGKLKHIKELGLKGIKIHPDYQDADIDDPRFMHIVDCANDLGLWTVTHAGIDVGLPEAMRSTPDKIANMLDAVKPDRFIAAHMGGWKGWDTVLERIAGRGVYLDTAFCFNGSMEDSVFLELVRANGPDKILFATDCPWGPQKEQLEHFMSIEGLSPEEKDLIAGRNAERILGI